MRAAIWIAVVLSAALADYTMVQKLAGGMKQRIYIKDDTHVRIETLDEKGNVTGGFLITGAKNYMIIREGGKERYVDAAGFMQLGRIMNENGMVDEESPEGGVGGFKLLRKVASKRVAGLPAEEWEVELIIDGVPKTERMVLSKDPAYQKAMALYIRAMERFAKQAGGEAAEEAAAYRLPGGYMVVSAEGMELVDFKAAPLPDKIFRAPKNVGGAQGGGLEQLMQMMQQMQGDMPPMQP